ncbi:hypothetical protein BIU82_01215 [Arthrobacter sp. SW1]|uniref:hypothetical protein n=1 Tax=Arthrobacter sp. SW1 TaxID=1920889 RepID=UPI000877DDFE|nr:hypothetical protein [Arthrobacter sp. SW1]OFI39704.1 hypothetical protein BIU82_01215 [Arthrobacter sp. SW1]
MNRNRAANGIPVLAAILLSAGLVACSDEGKGGPVWTADSASAGASGTESAAPSGGTPSGSPTPSGSSGGTATAVPTAERWKKYSDAGQKVSFELPEEWIAQSVAPDAGSFPGALKVEVKDGQGEYIATLHTGLRPAKAPACSAKAKRNYVVLSSVPVDVPHADTDATISPRVVFRVIQGYKYFGSYGITNLVAGTDGKACELRNLVQGPAGKGDIRFGDVPAVRAYATDEKVAPAKSFDTLDQAAKYVEQGTDFANVQRMLLSLRVTP